MLAQKNDSRITRIGVLLRKTRIDELPQLFNVLKGEMSLIGPRPERPELAEKFEERIPGFSRRLRVKAGLTGLAQVIQGYPRYIDGYRQKLAFDLVYIKRRSFALDAWIALKTVGVVVSGSGAR
jgi:lipopolysaccharide/colanic/teichoic acid biosynthesis glycosyltransferase